MNKKFHKSTSRVPVFIIMSSVCLALTSCAERSSGADPAQNISLQDLYKTSESDFNEIRSSSYDNLNFENASLKLAPDITGFSVINMKYQEVPQKESLAQFEKLLNETFPENVSKEDCFFGSLDIEVNHGDLTWEYPQIYSPQYYDKILNDSLPVDMYLYQTDTYQRHDQDQYFLMFPNCALLKMNRGDFTRSVDKNRGLGGWMPRDNYPIYEHVASDDYDRLIRFKNGEQTISDAVSYCESYFNDLHLTRNDNLSFIVNDVNIIETDRAVVYAPERRSGPDDDFDIIETGQTHQAVLFFMTRTYNGIPFDTQDEEGVFSEFSDGKDYDFDHTEALMCNAYDMEYYFLSVGNSNIVSERQIEDIIPLKQAADIVSSYMTNSIKFGVESVSLVYSNMIVDNSISDYQTEARPAWKFELKNGNDDLIYKVFVDVESGDCHYYTF